MTSASASKFPATISHQAALRHCDELSSEFFTRPALAGLAHRPVLAAAAGDLWSSRSPRYGTFSMGYRRISPTASKFVTPSSCAKAKRNSSSTGGLHQRNVNRVISRQPPGPQRRGHQSGGMIDAQQRNRRCRACSDDRPASQWCALLAATIWSIIGNCFCVWLQTLPKWHQSGTPWLFLHTPTLLTRRRWWIPCGRSARSTCRRWEMRRRFLQQSSLSGYPAIISGAICQS